MTDIAQDIKALLHAVENIDIPTEVRQSAARRYEANTALVTIENAIGVELAGVTFEGGVAHVRVPFADFLLLATRVEALAAANTLADGAL